MKKNLFSEKEIIETMTTTFGLASNIYNSFMVIPS